MGLQPEASDSEIKKAYRKLSVTYHPDKNKGDKAAEDKFREITEAYEILGDKEKRVIYDSSGIGAVRKMVSTPHARWPLPPPPPLPMTTVNRGTLAPIKMITHPTLAATS